VDKKENHAVFATAEERAMIVWRDRRRRVNDEQALEQMRAAPIPSAEYCAAMERELVALRIKFRDQLISMAAWLVSLGMLGWLLFLGVLQGSP
jgi:hypothetical protein